MSKYKVISRCGGSPSVCNIEEFECLDYDDAIKTFEREHKSIEYFYEFSLPFDNYFYGYVILKKGDETLKRIEYKN